LSPVLAATPVPAKETISEEFEAVLVTESVPEAGPGAVGAKVTFNARLWPAFSVEVPLKPLTANGALVVTALTVIAVLPEFVSVNDCEGLVVPT
jgi:hypothetical protein